MRGTQYLSNNKIIFFSEKRFRTSEIMPQLRFDRIYCKYTFLSSKRYIVDYHCKVYISKFEFCLDCHDVAFNVYILCGSGHKQK